tara:strand:+ start:117 stop:2015 length:1899 start_codon:yes stop_codon:yes gene_type:complete
MADYNAIKGRLVQTLSSDPTLTSSYEGQVWYNSTEGVLKGLVKFDAWSSSSNMSTARYGPGGGGTTTAGLVFGGYTGTAQSNLTEEYNGTGYVSGGNLGTARSGNAGTGTLTAGLSAGGVNPPSTYVANVEEYDGSSWSEVNDLPTAKGYGLQGGTQTASYFGGGRQGPPYSNPQATLEYDGTNWTSGGNLGVANYHGSSGGTLTAGWNLGGSPGPGAAPGRTNTSQFYDGTSWTAGPNGPTEISSGSGAGPQTSALAFTNGDASNPGGNNVLYVYDGSTWAVSPANLATARRSGARGGMSATGGQALASGGRSGTPAVSVTEEFNTSLNVVTPGAWASGGNMNTGRGRMGGFGIQTAAVASGGYIGPPGPNTNQGENYNGTTWSVSGSPSQTNNSQNATGTQTAGILISGGNPYVNIVQTYNGSTYSTAPFSTVTRRGNGGACGTQTAGLFFAGYSSTTPPHTGPGSNGWSEEYDGEGFTNTNVMVTGRSYVVAAGSQTAALSAGGGNGPTPSGSVCEEFDGTNWTTVNNMPTTTGSGAGGGTQTAAWYAGGSTGGPGTISTNGYTYDGTNWATAPSLGTSRYILAEAGNAPNTTGLVFGGFIPSPFTGMNNTEEFTGETAVTTASTLTTS